MLTKRQKQTGFTIVELLIVIVVIGILAAITVIAFNGVQQQTAASVLKNDLRGAANQLEIYKIDNSNQYVSNTTQLSKSDGTEYEYTSDGASYCLTAFSSTSGVPSYYISSSTGFVQEGACIGHGSSSVASLFVDAGGYFSCARRNNDLYCWGLGTSGQLGRSSAISSTSPVSVSMSFPGLSARTVTQLSSGVDHSCIIADALPFCWGLGNFGQIGNGLTSNVTSPTAVSMGGVLSGRTVTHISASLGTHTCAIADSLPFCWGAGGNGRLGNGMTGNSSQPVAVTTTGVLSGRQSSVIEAGGVHSCVLADGLPFCWGLNSSGQLGNGSTTSATTPVGVITSGALLGRTISQIEAGGAFNCVIANGAPFCWGNNAFGQLGNNSTSNANSPVAVNTTGVLAGRTVTDISVGEWHTCVIANGAPFCWGFNGSGQLGNGSTTNSSIPVAVDASNVLSGRTVTDISVGVNHSCVVADDLPFCWGLNSSGQLGNSSTTNSLTPVAVSPFPAP